MKEATKQKQAKAVIQKAKQMTKHEKMKMAAKANAKKLQIKQKTAPAP